MKLVVLWFYAMLTGGGPVYIGPFPTREDCEQARLYQDVRGVKVTYCHPKMEED